MRTSNPEITWTRSAVYMMAVAVLIASSVVLGVKESNAAPCQSGVRCFGTCCTGGSVCVNKGAGASCACPAGSFLCNGVCTSNSDENCGFCGNVCPENTSCVNGTCQCDAGFVFCGGVCVSTACDTGEQFNFATCQCEPVSNQNCTPEGGLCTSKNECCSSTAKCVPSGGRKTCQG